MRASIVKQEETKDNKKGFTDEELNALYSELFKVVMAISDDEARKIFNETVSLKKKLNVLKEDLKKAKKIVDEKTSELSRQKLISRILKLIQEMKIKGRLVGKTGETLKELVRTIRGKSFQTLRKLEEKIYSLL